MELTPKAVWISANVLPSNFSASNFRQRSPSPAIASHQPFARLPLFHRRQRVLGAIRSLNFIHGYLRILPMSPRFSAVSQHFEADDFEREREKIFQPVQMSVLFVEQDQHFLRQILGSIPLHSRCRKTHDPFAQLAQDLVARTDGLIDAFGR